MSAPVRLPEGYVYVSDHGQQCQRMEWVGEGPDPLTQPPTNESETR